jgi:hypothetical protein
MTITIFGVLVALIGGYLMLRASTLAMMVFVMLTTLMGGSAAFQLATGSSVLPSIEAVLLLAARCFLPSHRPPGSIYLALNANLPLLLFTAYGVFGALILPFIFAGVVDVAPLRPVFSPDPFATVPLSFTPQNLTAAGYLFTTMLGAVCAYVAVQSPIAEKWVARTAAIMGLAHAAIGYGGIIAAGTPVAEFFNFFRNAQYNQVSQDVGGFARMNGIMAEPSSYAGYGVIYFVFCTELWLRNIDRKWTGPAALVLLTALVVSTSTTAYVGIGGYTAILALRQLFIPTTITVTKLAFMAGGLLGAVAVVLALLTFQPGYLTIAEKVYRSMIVNKADSESALVRIMWARQGIEAFWASSGLGVGVGSFRSSSLGTAILGSMGVIGVATYTVHMLRVLKPTNKSTSVCTGHARVDVGVAAAWTVIAMSIPAFVAAPSPDPGLNWGLLGGIALGLRARPVRWPAR